MARTSRAKTNVENAVLRVTTYPDAYGAKPGQDPGATTVLKPAYVSAHGDTPAHDGNANRPMRASAPRHFDKSRANANASRKSSVSGLLLSIMRRNRPNSV